METASGYTHPEALVSTDWVAAHRRDPRVRIVDATYHLPHLKRDARAEYVASHIPDAVFFDIDAIAEPGTSLPHMLPPPDLFAHAVGTLGISNDDFVVVYDTYGLMSAPRAWWMFRVFGHDRVAVMDGGLPQWTREDRPVVSTPADPPLRRFTAQVRPVLVRSKADIVANLASKAEQILDARSSGRFHGTEAEPRPGLRGGHIPGACNLPFNLLLDTESKTVLPATALRQRYMDAGIDPATPVVASCGSGVTACALAFGLHLLGAERVSVYDGSWAEWGLPGDTPVET